MTIAFNISSSPTTIQPYYFLVANVDIWNLQNKHAPTPKGSHHYFDSSNPHILMHPRQRLALWNKAKPMLLTDWEETKQPRCPIAGLTFPWVLSSAGNLIQYLHKSYFLPYRNTVSTPDTSGAARENTIDLIIVTYNAVYTGSRQLPRSIFDTKRPLKFIASIVDRL